MYKTYKKIKSKKKYSSSAKQNIFKLKYYLLALLCAILAFIPSIYIGKQLSITIGDTVKNDIKSRVDFPWHDEEVENIKLSEIEIEHKNIYQQIEKNDWLNEVYIPVEKFLIESINASNYEEIKTIADSLNINISDEQAKILWKGIISTKNAPYYYLIKPLQSIVEEDIYKNGIIEEDRVLVDQKKAIDIDNGKERYTIIINGENAPKTKENLFNISSKYFDSRFSTWLTPEFRKTLKDIIIARIIPTLIYDQEQSEKELNLAKESLKNKRKIVLKDETIVKSGEIIDEGKLTKLKTEDYYFIQQQSVSNKTIEAMAKIILFFLIFIGIIIYISIINPPEEKKSIWLTATLGLVLLFSIFTYIVIWKNISETAIPIGIIIGIAALGTNRRTAILVTTASTIAGLIIMGGKAGVLTTYIASGWLFAYLAPQARWKNLLVVYALLSGILASAVYILWTVAIEENIDFLGKIYDISNIKIYIVNAKAFNVYNTILSWIISGVVLSIIIPLIEKIFNTTTRIHLQKLLTSEHVLLKRLIVEAPGTFHHSILVSTLAEAGAEAINADPLLAKVGSIFHDIGKLRKPEYFTENEAGVSRHDSLSPYMSSLIIINHVKDGVELAKSHNLPSAIIDMICQHHGTGLVKYFYHKAQQQSGKKEPLPQAPFLYPGPKPQSPEAAVIMIADSIEAASRSLTTPSPSRLKAMLHSIIKDRLNDGQFEESGITMTELAKVESIILRLLISMYHSRVKYPGQDKEKVTSKGHKIL